MMTICSVTDILNCGLPISADIREEEISLAIKTVSQFYLKNAIGSDLYAAICADTTHQYDDIVLGTDTIGGLRLALEHGVFAYILYDTIRATRYGSVTKESSESGNPKREDVLALCKHHWEICNAFVMEVAESLQIEMQKTANNFIFNEL